MKNLSSYIITLIILLTISNQLSAQDGSTFLELRLNGNNSDMNYGIDELSDLFPVSDYPLFSNTGSPGIGFTLGLGAGYQLNNRFEIRGAVDYIKYNYEVFSGVFDTTTPVVGRPIRPEVPIIISGDVGYNYLSIEGGLRYSFHNDPNKGLFAGLMISNMIHLNTDWTFDVKYEDQRLESKQDLSAEQEGIEYNNLVTIGLEIGYEILLTDQLSIAPTVALIQSLTDTVENEETLNPSAQRFGVQLRWNL